MFHVRVLSAENLPVHTKKVWKTKIYCFSSSSRSYFYDSFKSKENTTNPRWDGEFDTDLFRCSSLTFILYSSRLFSREVFIGKVDIDINNFFEQESGKQILATPQSCVQCDFPITSCVSPKAFLSLSFSYLPKFYRLIDFQSVPTPIIHVFTTYKPDIQTCPIEIELIQVYITKNKKNGLNGLYYNFNKLTTFESVGYSSCNRYIHDPSGQSQIITLIPHRIDSKCHFFILNNNSNFTGLVTLNFLAEKDGGTSIFKEQKYFKPRLKSVVNGTIKTVDVYVEPYCKICVPVCLNYVQRTIRKDVCDFQQFPLLKYEKSDTLKEYPIEFYSQIIETAKTVIPDWNEATFYRTNVMTNFERISLIQIMSDLNVQIGFNLRIYVGGVKSSSDSDDISDYWGASFSVFDKKKRRRCPDIEKSLTKEPYHVIPIFNKKPLFDMKWNSYVSLNLDQFDIEKVFVFSVYCSAGLNETDKDGFYLISQMNGEDETLLFRNMVYVDRCRPQFAVCFRLEFIEDGWEIIPMRYYFNSKGKMDPVIESLFVNNWVMPDIFLNQTSECNSDSSDGELLIENVEL